MDGEEIFYAVDSPVIRSIKSDIQDIKSNIYYDIGVVKNGIDDKIMASIEEIESEIKTSSVECNRVSTEIRGMLLDYINCEIDDVKASQKKLRKEMVISYICAFLFFSLFIFFCK